jgi:hypothetical protein
MSSDEEWSGPMVRTAPDIGARWLEQLGWPPAHHPLCCALLQHGGLLSPQNLQVAHGLNGLDRMQAFLSMRHALLVPKPCARGAETQPTSGGLGRPTSGGPGRPQSRLGAGAGRLGDPPGSQSRPQSKLGAGAGRLGDPPRKPKPTTAQAWGWGWPFG